MTVNQVVREVLSDREFYQKSGGGVTISGGDPLSQWQFTLGILRECKRQRIDTCLESSLHCKEEVLTQVYPFVDLVYTDIKHMDPVKHKEYTGADNRLILSNIRNTVAAGKPLVIRIPLVPGHNDDENNIRATAGFILNELHNRVLQVQLLPFRPIGAEKYAALGIAYPMAHIRHWERPEYEEATHRLAAILASYGINARAGATAKLP